MMCCAIGALLVATIAMWRSRFKAVLDLRLFTRWAATSVVAAIALIVGLTLALAVQHYYHHAAPAQLFFVQTKH
jgi:hypothetical protein